MDLNFLPDDDAFRREVRAFIRDHYPPKMRVPNPCSLLRRTGTPSSRKADSAFFDVPE